VQHGFRYRARVFVKRPRICRDPERTRSFAKSSVGEHNVSDNPKLLKELRYRAVYASKVAVLPLGGFFRLCGRREFLFYHAT
jgi:hypothetical protein